jgi:hypothetical protein
MTTAAALMPWTWGIHARGGQASTFDHLGFYLLYQNVPAAQAPFENVAIVLLPMWTPYFFANFDCQTK